LKVVDSSGNVLDQVNLRINSNKSLLGGSITAMEEEHGLIKFFLASSASGGTSPITILGEPAPRHMA